MALVKGKSLGSAEVREFSVNTVGELREAMGVSANQSASVDGEARDNSFELSDAQLITFAPSVKGGMTK